MSDEVTVKPINSKDEFDTLRASGKTIFIDFYADWCGPCKQISPEFERLAKENAKGDTEFYKVNIDQIPEIAQALSIRSVPTFHAYKNNEKLDTMVGANKLALAVFIKTGLGRALIV